MNPAIEELNQLLILLKTEWEEDAAQYAAKVVHTPLQERRKEGMSWYPVVVTESGFGLGDKLYLEVEKTSEIYTPHNFGTGKAVALFSNSGEPKKRPTIQGVVAGAGFNRLKIIFNEEELPDWLDDGKLGIDLLFDETSYKEMESAVRKVKEAERNRIAQLRDILLGQGNPGFKPVKFTFQVPHLNESQNQAVQNVLLAEDVAIIHGPPGTGKTTTLVEAIIQTLKTEKQVLVCSPSNAAVDLLTEKLAARQVEVVRIGNPARVSEDMLQHTVDAKIQADKRYMWIKQMRRQADEFNRLAHKYKRHFGKAERDQRKMILAEARKLSKEANDTEKYITDSLFEKAQVITCTLVGAANRLLAGKRFPTVFIDEAAQALEPATWIPILKSDRVIFAGDHCQLPPTVKSQKAERGGLSTTLFEKCMARQQVSVMLNVQYRMHEKIMSFSSREFYHSNLKAHETVATQTLATDDWLSQPLIFIDTAGCSFEEKFNQQNQSVSNPEEANLLLRYINALLSHLEENALLQLPFRIGIITPYRAQVEYLQEHIQQYEKTNMYKHLIAVGTVDGFQGQERHIICISLVRSNNRNEIGFLQDIRRMNVALTRAKQMLIVIGDSATLANHPFYKNFIQYVEENNAYRSAWEWME